MTKLIYRFGRSATDGGAEDVAVLGGKGANLAEMARLGLPVPPGLTISADACARFLGAGDLDPELLDQVEKGLAHLEIETGRVFGSAASPLVLSVRSGARVSMPGMMDTVLNVGLTDEIVEGLGDSEGDRRFAWDSYRRLVQMYGDVVMGVETEAFEDVLEDAKARFRKRQESEIAADEWQEVVSGYKNLILAEAGRPFPQNPREQLFGAVSAVFSSWTSRRASAYRRINGIPDDWGTAVNIQSMVFGNRDDLSCTGVVFTRNPSNGSRELFGEFMINAQGEDVVSGLRTPLPLTEPAREAKKAALSMERAMPRQFEELASACALLERHYRDVQDVEFTVEQGRLWILQTRTAKRNAKAAARIAVDMAYEGLITQDEAVSRVDPEVLAQDPHPLVDPEASVVELGRGLAASPGAATGEIVFHSEDAVEAAEQGRSVILVRVETMPDDIEGMNAAAGVLTTRGGMTSHAAVVARGMGKPCVVGAAGLHVDFRSGRLVAGSTSLVAGDVITIDGSTGRVIDGVAPTIQPELAHDIALLREWTADAAMRAGSARDEEEPDDEDDAAWRP